MPKMVRVLGLVLSLIATVGASLDLQLWGDSLVTDLNKLTSTATGLEKLQQSYTEVTKQHNVQFHDVNGLTLVEKMAHTLGEKVFKPKVTALKKAVKEAEKLASNYTWNPNIQIKDVPIINSKELNESDPMYSNNDLFKQPVNMSLSSVHIPVEIYQGHTNILNSLSWSGMLDKVWTENRQNDPDILWQYFGSQDGFIRTSPASKWRRQGVDLFDVRRRPWYTAGSSSPKDMIILMDTSGSTYGQALQLMKFAVKFLLDTIGENDFVSIIKFSNEPSFVMDCLNEKRFLQANYWNKQDLYNAVVNNVKAEKMANYAKAFEFSFKQFKEFSRNATDGAGANCNRVIMLLSDGTTEKPESVFDTHNRDKMVRVFTFAIGRTASDVAALKWMACRNKGYFSVIYAVGAIMSKVQEYIPSLARGPYSAYGVKDMYMSPAYNDIWGLGMMTTITLPVYNRSSDSIQSNQTILGVMGIDVTVGHLISHTPYSELGPAGYAFALDSNGYIVFHPNLRATDLAKNGWLQDPPNVDMFHVEINDPTKYQVRRKMIDQKSATEEFESYVLYPGEHYVAKNNRTYSYIPIPGTNFSLCVVSPSQRKKHVSAKGFDLMQAAEELERILTSQEDFAVLLAPWTTDNDGPRYCKTLESVPDEMQPVQSSQNLINSSMSTPVDKDKDVFVKRIIATLKSTKCNNSLIQQLAWDLMSVNISETLWKNLNSQIKKDITGVFVSTNGGLTRVFPASLREGLEDKVDIPTAEYYLRTIDTQVYLYSTPYKTGKIHTSNDTMSNHDVMVTKSIVIPIDSGHVFKPGVVGAMVKQEAMVRVMNSSSDGYCGNSDDNYCYLLDNGGFIISTNQEYDADHIGRWIGDVDSQVMYLLHLHNIYENTTRLDFQAACKKQTKSSSTGSRNVFMPSLPFYEMLTLTWWSNKLSWAYLNINLYNWLFGSSEDMGVMAAEIVTSSTAVNESCVVKQHQYYYTDRQSMRGNFTCDNCTRWVSAQRLNGSNLLLVVADQTCHNTHQCPQYSKLIQAPQRLDHIPTACQQEHWYRKRPGQCWNHDDREDTSQCNRAISLQSPSQSIIWTTVFLTFIHTCIRTNR